MNVTVYLLFSCLDTKGISGFFETVSKQENNKYTVTFVRVSYQKEYLDSLNHYLNKKIINIQ
jgi:hypothetical protein